MIEHRERELSIKAAEVYEATPAQPKNWPRCYPLLRHSILSDVPGGLRRTVAFMGYLGWFLFMVVVIANFGCAVATVILSFVMKQSDWAFSPLDRVKMLILAAFFVIAGIPGHFIFSYLSVYHAVRLVTIPRFFMFFIGYLAPIVVCVVF